MIYGFLINHYAGHQAYHSLPIAFALSEKYPHITVKIMVSSQNLYDLAQKIAMHWPDHKCQIQLAKLPIWAKIADALIGKLVFVKKEAVLQSNDDFFKSIDVLVVPEKNSLRLKKNKNLQHLKFVRIRHGAGDRTTGLDEHNKKFDLILASGKKMYDRLTENGYAHPDRIRIIGYPKFDVIEKDQTTKNQKLFDNDNPVVLYAPHFKRHESSWTAYGRAIIDFFSHHQEYNLIFAPHILLYKRGTRHGAVNLKAYSHFKNIHIDVGSQASIDMTYTRAADIYLGDMSSQIYEFLHTLKPCIFFNAHNMTDWKNNETYLHWHMGDVISSTSQLKQALDNACSKHVGQYKTVQEKIIANTFDLQSTPSSERAADAIIQFFS